MFHVAIDALPPAAMIDQHAIAAGFGTDFGDVPLRWLMIHDAVPRAQYGASSGREHIDALLHGRRVTNSEIRTVMTVIALGPAPEIGSPRCRVGIKIVHSPTGFAELARS